MKTLMVGFSILMTVAMISLQFQQINQREQLIQLQTDNATQAQRIRVLEDSFDNYPFSHASFESDINLIGSVLFPNWDKASELWAKRGK